MPEEALACGHVLFLDGQPHDGEVVVLAIVAERALLLHVSDGCSRTWMPVAHLAGKPRLANAAETFAARAKTERTYSYDAVSYRGTHEALRRAETAGRWDTLSRLVAALTSEPPR